MNTDQPEELRVSPDLSAFLHELRALVAGAMTVPVVASYDKGYAQAVANVRDIAKKHGVSL